MLKDKPTRYSTLFNINYYVNSDNQYIGTRGTQRLNGRLTLNYEIVNGDEHVYGESYMRDEPIINTVSDPTTLLNNNLVSKSYVDYRTIRPSTNPTVTTLLNNNQITNNHLVSKSYSDYSTTHPTNEPVVTTLLNVNDLTINHLVSKKYVDDKFTLQSQNADLYPTSFFYGKQYDENNSTFTRQIESGMSYIRFKNLNSSIYNVVFDCYWYINRSAPNTAQYTWYGNSKTSIYVTSTYSVNFFHNGQGAWSNAVAELISGSNIHNNFTFEGITIPGFIKFGLYNGKPSVHINFPNSYNNQISKDGWISGFGGSVKIVTSQPNEINQIVLESGNDNGLAYFNKLWYE